MTLEDRFWSKVLKGKADDCWNWEAGRTPRGYGSFAIGRRRIDRRMISAHRQAYQLAIGPIPQGHYVCHSCDNPPCCNPGHLFVGTQHDNMRDMLTKGRGKKTTGAGELVGTARLTWPQVVAIRQIYKGGEVTQSQLGERFRVADTTISRITSGKGWLWKNE